MPSNHVRKSQNGLKALQTTSPGLCVEKYENSFYIAYLQGTSSYICLSIDEGLQNSSVWESSAQVFCKLITLVQISKAKVHQSEWEKWRKNPATLLPENHPYQNKCMHFTFTLWLIKWHFCSKTVQKISLPQAESIHLMHRTGEAFEIYWESVVTNLTIHYLELAAPEDTTCEIRWNYWDRSIHVF